MRKGQNKSKDKKIELKPSSHRIIIPLYIPKENGYYKDSYEIFELCLFSLIKTSISTIKISVISDGCCQSVNDKLLKLHKENQINELIIESENIGKINAVFKALRTAEERLITITDADILFVNNWEKEVISVFESFPKAGAVCPIPIFRTHFRLTSNIWINYLFSKKLKFLPVKNTDALTKFANSIGWPRLDKKWKDSILTLEAANGKIAVVGGSHVAALINVKYLKNLHKKIVNINLEVIVC